MPSRRGKDADEEPEGPADEGTAALTANYWRAYDERMATIGFLAMARQFPSLVAKAIRLGWQANPRDITATISLNLISGFFTGFALLTTTSVLQALFATGPTPARVHAALPSLALVAAAVAV